LANDLVAFIEYDTELNTPDANGNTLKQSLEFVEKSRPSHWQADERLNGKSFTTPKEFHLYGAALLQMYYSMTAGRQSGYMGVQPLSWSDVKAWLDMNEFHLTPFEIGTLKRLDVAYVNKLSRVLSDQAR